LLFHGPSQNAVTGLEGRKGPPRRVSPQTTVIGAAPGFSALKIHFSGGKLGFDLAVRIEVAQAQRVLLGNGRLKSQTGELQFRLQ
jgi:hypothetical protein